MKLTAVDFKTEGFSFMTEKYDIKAILKNYASFENLPESVFQFLRDKSQEISIEEGETFFEEGQKDERLIIIKSGGFDAFRQSNQGNNVFLRRIPDGELVGLTSFFTNGLRSATLKAFMPTKVWALDFPTLKQYMFPEGQDGSLLSEALISLLSEKIRTKNKLIAESSPNGRKGKTKIAFFDTQPYMEAVFKKFCPEDQDYTFINARLSAETARLAEGHRAVCSFVNDTVDELTIDILRNLGIKLVALRCAGFNHVDLQACEARDVTVVRVPEYSPYAVAEHATAMLMCLNRRLHRAYNRVREGNFTLNELVGFDIHGKTVGIIGTGKIGKAFVKQMNGFGANVVAYDLYPDLSLSDAGLVQYLDLNDVFAKSDIISLHSPLTPETHHMIDGESISRMKKGVILVNTSRGGLIDTVALINGLKTKQIGGAALDVYEEESEYFFQDKSADVISDDTLARLLTFNNVLVTSHQAFLTEDALTQIAKITIENIQQYEHGYRGKDLKNLVVPPKS
ncbi:MAG: cyclic nucleotide-binding domain-containing protein [Pseudobacteriovorax sp.]|nr:cyclic nucleotide-binding domain-containing protein [Pseudobacteriovorax sp.]